MIKYPDPVKRSELPAVVYYYRDDKGVYLGPLESSPTTPDKALGRWLCVPEARGPLSGPSFNHFLPAGSSDPLCGWVAAAHRWVDPQTERNCRTCQARLDRLARR